MTNKLIQTTMPNSEPEYPNVNVNIPATALNYGDVYLVTAAEEVAESAGESKISIPWCGEVEKMISGMHFRGSLCEPLMKYRFELTKALKAFNEVPIAEGATSESLKSTRMAIANKFIGKLGKDCNIPAPFFVGCGFTLFIGDQVFMNRDVSIYNNAPVTIGDRTLIGPGVMICTDSHEIDPQIRKEKGGSFAKSIRIGSDCWIGARATILPGVTIGNGVVVAAGAVVTKNVAPEIVVGGVPAKFIRSVFESPAEDETL